MLSIKELEDVANILRRDSIVSTSEAGSGHPSSCMSCADLMACLFFSEMKYDLKDANNPDNDEFVLSKGHATPILYSALYRAGCINFDLLKLRKFGSPLEGHPMPGKTDWIKVATGSLGQGLSIGTGFALAGKLQKRNYRTFVLLGDSELSEGSIYEALQLAPKYKLNNLIAIVDVNRLGQTGETIIGHNLDVYEKRFKSFGWKVHIINGHNVKQIISCLKETRKSEKPVMILAKTIKGRGVSFMEDKEGWHGRALSDSELYTALKELPLEKMPSFKVEKPSKIKSQETKEKIILNKYNIDEMISTRDSYGSALASLAKSNSSVIAIDAEVSNSTRSEEVKKSSNEQFIQVYIAEQNMIGVSLGLSKKGFNVYASTFSAFLSRAHDQLRMSALSDANFSVCGSHSGVSIGEDGASQMGLEDIAMFRDLPNSIIFYPSDAVSCQKLTLLSSKLKGLKYTRTTRGKTKVLYKNNEDFKIGDFKTLKSSDKDKIILIGSGITLHECLKAHEELKKKNISSAVIDLYCIKPLNSKKLLNFIKSHGEKIIVSEDHYEAGGIGEMISEIIVNTNIKMKHLCIKSTPHSGKPTQLLNKYEIDSEAIVKTSNSLLK